MIFSFTETFSSLAHLTPSMNPSNLPKSCHSFICRSKFFFVHKAIPKFKKAAKMHNIVQIIAPASAFEQPLDSCRFDLAAQVLPGRTSSG